MLYRAVTVSVSVRSCEKSGVAASTKCPFICSAEPRGLCGDPRIFDDLTKLPQVFRHPGGSPALQNERPIRCIAIFSRLLNERPHKGFLSSSEATGSLSLGCATIPEIGRAHV